MKPNSSLARSLALMALLLLVGESSLSPAIAASPTTNAARAARATGPRGRIAWTTAKVAGTPEPPPPFQLERVYPRLTFRNPLDFQFAPGSERRFVAEQSGRIYSFPDDARVDHADVFFDPSQVRGLNRIPDCVGVNQVNGFAFHPKFAENHFVYICYLLEMNPNADRSKALRHAERLSRFEVQGGTGPADPPRCRMDSETVLLDCWGYGHTGGCIRFGPDGCLYLSLGDGGDPTPPDPFNTGQDISDLLASILRIDVDHAEAGQPYSIPKDNPFVNTPGARGEVWAYGLRNPWRFSFDRATGSLWAGDVGWETWEMVDRVERGGNYGWSITEGPGPVHPDAKPGPTPILPPALYLSHAEGASITGGYVYRGLKLPALAGQYIFGDWETRRLWAAPLVDKGLGKHQIIAQTDQRIVSFGEDRDGELYIVDYEGGGLWRIVPHVPDPAAAPFPRKLSETGLYASVEGDLPAPGVAPFTINAEQWVDGATSQRWVAVPGKDAVKNQAGTLTFPKNSVLTRTFYLNDHPRADSHDPAPARRRVETQMLHFDGKRWHGYTYRWNPQQTDADLVGPGGDDATYHVADPAAPGGAREQSWHFASRAQCLQCHNSFAGVTLAFTPPQLARVAPGDQAVRLHDQGILSPPPALANPADESADLAIRARSYLHANCAHCHRFGGGGSANIELQFSVEDEQTKALGTRPTQGTFGLDDARIIAPGQPQRSVLLYRMSKLGSGHMPHTGSSEIDPAGLDLIWRWIEQLPVDGVVEPINAKDKSALEELLRPSLGNEALSLAVDHLLASTSGALQLMRAIDENRFNADTRQRVVTRAYANERDEIRGLFARFVPPGQRIKTLGVSFNPQDILTLDGDAARGRKVFFDLSGGLCQHCHQVAGQGESFGPDLSHVGGKYDRVQLLENVAEPAKAIAPGFTTYRVKMKKGPPQMGLIASRNGNEIFLKTGPGPTGEVRLSAGDVERVTVDPASMMPEGLLGGLTAQQAADLLEYLQSLK